MDFSIPKTQPYYPHYSTTINLPNHLLTLNKQRLKEKVEKLARIDEIKNRIAVQTDMNPMECYERYRLIYPGPYGNRKEKTLMFNIDDEIHYGHGVIQEYVEWVKNDFAKDIYEDLVNKENKEKERIAMLYQDFASEIKELGGDFTIAYESLGMCCKPEGTASIHIPVEQLPRLMILKPNLAIEKDRSWIEGLPEVAKVEVYNNRVVKMTYIDGTFTKAVCSENDIFDLDVGITICAMKRLFGENGTRHYNNYISHVHAVMEKNNKKKLAENAQRMIDKDKKRKAELKKAAKKLKQKEEQIDIQKQAIIRAHQEIEAAQREEGLA